MTGYTDIFVVPVPHANVAAYRTQAELFAKVWREHGASRASRSRPTMRRPAK